MIYKSSTYFPFDGTCKCSRDGDIKLIFDDSTALKVHSAVLKMASSVFNSMLTDCPKTKELKLEKTSRETWVHILNHLHPAATLVFSTFNPANNIVQLTDLLEQARKFSLESLFTILDDAMSTNFPEELNYTPVQKSNKSNGPTHTHIYNTVLRFELELPKTSAKVSANIVQYLKSFPNFNRPCSNCGYSYNYNQYSSAQQNQTYQVQRKFAKDIIKGGSHDFYKKLVDDLIDNVL